MGSDHGIENDIFLVHATDVNCNQFGAVCDFLLMGPLSIVLILCGDFRAHHGR